MLGSKLAGISRVMSFLQSWNWQASEFLADSIALNQ